MMILPIGVEACRERVGIPLIPCQTSLQNREMFIGYCYAVILEESVRGSLIKIGFALKKQGPWLKTFI
ncbi:hypothetical protein GXN76_01985 [Kroppenstedtia pulmonis]|uniref:Uncharacterized protein n=1 Tax=Kroppenstedtia pulmonis TaxID=1380685 RepID=A0A7D4CK26_9BACL|nr:hypothetical protein [Kroppenstedtia pulmonis]QKG83358.1 hypothetical protein GXN76_01985 [Kroppenstedtia pulmonis]